MSLNSEVFLPDPSGPMFLTITIAIDSWDPTSWVCIKRINRAYGFSIKYLFVILFSYFEKHHLFYSQKRAKKERIMATPVIGGKAFTHRSAYYIEDFGVLFPSFSIIADL